MQRKTQKIINITSIILSVLLIVFGVTLFVNKKNVQTKAAAGEGRVFVTSQTYTGDEITQLFVKYGGDIDKECQSIADSKSLGGEWVTVIERGRPAVKGPAYGFKLLPSLISSNGIFNINGKKLAPSGPLIPNNYTDFINVDENGNTISSGNTDFWTGYFSDWPSGNGASESWWGNNDIAYEKSGSFWSFTDSLQASAGNTVNYGAFGMSNIWHFGSARLLCYDISQSQPSVSTTWLSFYGDINIISSLYTDYNPTKNLILPNGDVNISLSIMKNYMKSGSYSNNPIYCPSIYCDNLKLEILVGDGTTFQNVLYDDNLVRNKTFQYLGSSFKKTFSVADLHLKEGQNTIRFKVSSDDTKLYNTSEKDVVVNVVSQTDFDKYCGDGKKDQVWEKCDDGNNSWYKGNCNPTCTAENGGSTGTFQYSAHFGGGVRNASQLCKERGYGYGIDTNRNTHDWTYPCTDWTGTGWLYGQWCEETFTDFLCAPIPYGCESIDGWGNPFPNGVCESGENYMNCPLDCKKPVCGNGVTEGLEKCDNGVANNGTDGKCSATCTNVGVGNIPPVADFTADHFSGTFPLTVKFTDQSTDSDGTIVEYIWGFGDIASSSHDKNPTFTFPGPGEWHVDLTVKDNGGLTSRVEKIITVTSPATPITPTYNYFDKYLYPKGILVYTYADSTPSTLTIPGSGSHNATIIKGARIYYTLEITNQGNTDKIIKPKFTIPEGYYLDPMVDPIDCENINKPCPKSFPLGPVDGPNQISFGDVTVPPGVSTIKIILRTK